MLANDLTKYTETTVKYIINERDPLGLLAGGAPEDEFKNEIKKIIVLLSKVETVSQLAEGIATIFTNAFDRPYSKEDYMETAQKIWIALERT